MKLQDFRKHVTIPATMNIYSPDRKEITINVAPLSGGRKRRILAAMDYIKTRLQPNEWEINYEVIEIAARYALFLETDSKSVGAYTLRDVQCPLTIFNKHLFGTDERELAVTVLHEMLHLLETMEIIDLYGELSEDDMHADSTLEIQHDIICYSLIGVPIPLSHPAYESLREFLSSSSSVEMVKR